jgi:hypothetical protein
MIEFVEGNRGVRFTVGEKDAVYPFIESALKAQRYRRLSTRVHKYHNVFLS